jgi:hypothetical protein
MTFLAHLLLLATILTPLGLLASAVSARGWARLPGLLVWAPLPGLAAALLAAGQPPLVIYPDWLRPSTARARCCSASRRCFGQPRGLTRAPICQAPRASPAGGC